MTNNNSLNSDEANFDSEENEEEEVSTGVELSEGFGPAEFRAALQRSRHLGKLRKEEEEEEEEEEEKSAADIEIDLNISQIERRERLESSEREFNQRPANPNLVDLSRRVKDSNVSSIKDEERNPLKTMRGTSFSPIPLLNKQEESLNVESSELIIPQSFASSRKVVEPSATALMLAVDRGVKSRKITQDILDRAPEKSSFTGTIPLLDEPRNLTKSTKTVRSGFGDRLRGLNLGARTSTFREFSKDFGISVGSNLRDISREVASTSKAVASLRGRQLGRGLQRVKDSERLREGLRTGVQLSITGAKGLATGSGRVNRRFFVPLGQRESLFGPRLGSISDREKELINIASGGRKNLTSGQQVQREVDINLLEIRNKEILVELENTLITFPVQRLLESEFKENRLKITALQSISTFSSSEVAIAKAELEQFTKSRDAKRASQDAQLKSIKVQSAASVSRIQKASSKFSDKLGRSLLTFEGGLSSTERTKRTLAALRGDAEFDDDPFRNLDELFPSENSGRFSSRSSARPQINLGAGEKTVTEKSRQQLTLKGKGRIERVNVQIDTPI